MGMKYLKMYESFKEEEIHEICEKYGITNYTINNGVVDVNGNVNLRKQGLHELPLKFGIVTGYFYCDNNQLTSLIGSPKEVGGYFYCSVNDLTSLEGCPKEVGVDFSCNDNKLTSLEFCPSKVGGHFQCDNNQLTSLEGVPKYVSDYFSCGNNNLTSLEGGPKYVSDDFYCDNNQLTSLIGCPSEVGGRFDCGGNPVHEIYKLFGNYRLLIYSLDYNYFRGGNKINKMRLTQALLEIGKECPENIKGYVWE